MSVSRFRLPALHWQILIAIVLAALTGLFAPEQVGPVNVFATLDFIGKLFLRALQMLVVPLIATAVISSVAKLSGEQAFGRLGAKTVSFYLGTTLLAVIVGLLVMNIVRPGHVSPEVSAAMIASAGEDASKVASKIEGRSGADIIAIFQRMIPSNIFEALTKNGEMLAVITFSLLFGYFVTRLPAERSARVAQWWDDLYEVMILITDAIIRFTPIGVFALVAATVAGTGFAAILPLGGFFLCVIAGLAIHMFLMLPLIMRFAGITQKQHLRAVSPALLTAFSTASSAATVPLTLECLQKNSGVSRRVAGFTIPLGATVNMNGTALYECAVVLFIAQIYGIELSLSTQVTVVVLSLLTSIGVAGIPAASLVAIVVILGAVGLPLEAIGIVLAVDRLLDMARTTVNVYGDTVAAVVIARSEGEKPYTN